MSLTVARLLKAAEKTERSEFKGVMDLVPPVPALSPNGTRVKICSVGISGVWKNKINITRFPTWFQIRHFRLEPRSTATKRRREKSKT